MKAIFFGSGIFAVSPLKEILNSDRHEIIAVVGKRDRPAGRGLKLTSTPVVQFAMDSGLKLFQPENLQPETLEELIELDWNVAVVAEYGEILPRWLLDLQERIFINIHPSLLPRLRGPAPIERAILNGCTITGVTTILMSEKVDCGDVLMSAEEPIFEHDTTGTLRERLSKIASRLVIDTLDGLESGTLTPVKQKEEMASYAPAITQEEANIDWTAPAEYIDRLTRALDPDTGAYTFFRGRRIKIWSVKVTDVLQVGQPGMLTNMGREEFFVNTGTYCVQIMSLQPEGKRRMSWAEFARGQRVQTGEIFTRKP